MMMNKVVAYLFLHNNTSNFSVLFIPRGVDELILHIGIEH